MKALFEGFLDRWNDGLLWCEQLYRRPFYKRALWRLGWIAAFALFARSRTNNKKRFGRPLVHSKNCMCDQHFREGKTY